MEANHAYVPLVVDRHVGVLVLMGRPLDYAVVRGAVVRYEGDAFVRHFEDGRRVHYVSEHYSQQYGGVLAFDLNARAMVQLVVHAYARHRSCCNGDDGSIRGRVFLRFVLLFGFGSGWLWAPFSGSLVARAGARFAVGDPANLLGAGVVVWLLVYRIAAFR